jgi:hypothetical protein
MNNTLETVLWITFVLLFKSSFYSHTRRFFSIEDAAAYVESLQGLCTAYAEYMEEILYPYVTFYEGGFVEERK